MRVRRALVVIVALLATITGCTVNEDSPPPVLLYCWVIDGCTAAPKKGSPQEVVDKLSDRLRKADFKGSPQDDGSTKWTKGEDAVRLTTNLKGSYVTVSFQEGKVDCHQISEATTIPDPVQQIDDIRRAGRAAALVHQEWKCKQAQ